MPLSRSKSRSRKRGGPSIPVGACVTGDDDAQQQQQLQVKIREMIKEDLESVDQLAIPSSGCLHPEIRVGVSPWEILS